MNLGYPIRNATQLKNIGEFMYVNVQALLSLTAGILILIRPALLNYIIAIYLIIVGVLGLAR